jgi:hypothetical protein
MKVGSCQFSSAWCGFEIKIPALSPQRCGVPLMSAQEMPK